MRKSFGSLVFGVVVTAMATVTVAGCTETASSTSATSLARRDLSDYRYTGEVYLLRGLANVFSTGLDDMNAKFRRRGVNSKVDNHAVWQTWADDIIARNQRNQVSYPIIIMGHSLGANATVQMAHYLGEHGVHVSYAVAFDPTITTEPGPNVDDVVNYYLPNGRKGNNLNVVVAGDGFKGEISNLDVSGIEGMNHFNIEKNPELQVQVMTKTMSLLKPHAVALKPGANR